VRTNDIICELDSSSYAESTRTAQIEVDSARAALTKAELDVKAAEIGYKLYVEGTRAQSVQSFMGQLALSESDFNRQTARLAWSDKMKSLGFLSNADYTGEVIALMRSKQALGKAKRTIDIFNNFSDAISKRSMEGRLEGLRANLDYSRIRLQKSEERLEKFKEQVANCTIRAPHDGFLVYARGRGRPGGSQIALGTQVRDRQELFYLPDLAKLEVQALIHESILARTRPKLPVRLRVEVFPDQQIKGKIGSIAPLPIPVDQNNEQSTDTRNFLAKIALDTIPQGTKPGMSVEVEILSSLRDNVLLVPIKSVKYREGRPHCYLKRGDQIEERAIDVGQMNRQFFELTSGLKQGERVVLDPMQIDATMSVIRAPERAAPRSRQVAAVRY
jgi:HlyD family secretion protein